MKTKEDLEYESGFCRGFNSTWTDVLFHYFENTGSEYFNGGFRDGRIYRNSKAFKDLVGREDRPENRELVRNAIFSGIVFAASMLYVSLGGGNASLSHDSKPENSQSSSLENLASTPLPEPYKPQQ